jgi:SAM-dependent methyltransferase
MIATLDAPLTDALCDPLALRVEGWIHGDKDHENIIGVEICADGERVGLTYALALRPDVVAALALPAGIRTGFLLDAHCPAARFDAPLTLTVHAVFRDGSRSAPLVTREVRMMARDYRRNHFGVLLDQSTIAVQRRGNIFATGPSLSEPSPEITQLLARYLPRAPRRILDVGCGIGSYGRGLIAQGYDWHGAEVSASDCAELKRLGLPHTHVSPGRLPFADAAFDAAIAIEVLEHIEEPRPFLTEIRRAAPRQLIVSVPNSELLGYLYDYLATPWHMLEGDHKNFFTRWSLGALLGEFYPRVEVGFHTPYPLRTVEGTPLHYNLFAVASTP